MLIIPRLPTSPGQAEPGIQGKADVFAKRVDKELAERIKRAADARIMKLAFPEDRPLNVFYAGDSLSYSLYASTEAKGYRPLLNAALGKHGEVVEQRATKADEKALFKVGNVLSVPASGVDLAIIELGTNDVGTGHNDSTPVIEFRKQYDALLDKVQRSKGVKIICVGAWGLSGSQGTDPYDFLIQTVCAEHGGQYVDLTAAYGTKGSFGPKGAKSFLGPSDNFHPNDKGHALIAALILERIRVV